MKISKHAKTINAENQLGLKVSFKLMEGKV